MSTAWIRTAHHAMVVVINKLVFMVALHDVKCWAQTTQRVPRCGAVADGWYPMPGVRQTDNHYVTQPCSLFVSVGNGLLAHISNCNNRMP
jgi:hypothetical protein